MGARPIEHGRKVGTKAKQILPMLSTVTANIPHKALFPLHLQVIQKNQGSANSIPTEKEVKLFHKRARSPHYNPRYPIFQRQIQEHGCPSLLANKGLRPSKVKPKESVKEKKNLSSRLQMAKRLIQDVPNLCSPFSLSKKLFLFRQSLGEGSCFIKLLAKESERERA